MLLFFAFFTSENEFEIVWVKGNSRENTFLAIWLMDLIVTTISFLCYLGIAARYLKVIQVELNYISFKPKERDLIVKNFDN